MAAESQARNSSAGASPYEEDIEDDGHWPTLPKLFTQDPPIHDSLQTETSRAQDQTVDECLPFLKGEHAPGNAYGIPHIDRQRHIDFLHKMLGKLPGAFVAADPSRPWFFYWCLAALTLLGEDPALYRERLVETVRPMQNASGGFAGGFGQTSHLATTYATVLSLALVGGEDAYEIVDRRAMWKWLCSLKQADGGFQMALGGEEDVRYVTPSIHVNFFLCNSSLTMSSLSSCVEAPTAQPSSSRCSTSPSICHQTRLHAPLATLACSRV